MADSEQSYLRDVQYRFPDRLKARSILHTRYGRGDWFADSDDRAQAFQSDAAQRSDLIARS